MKIPVLLALVSIGCADIEISVKETTKGNNAICHPGDVDFVNSFRYWRICLPDNELTLCVVRKHRIAGGWQKMPEGLNIILFLHPVLSTDEGFVANVFINATDNTSAVNISCGVTQSGGLVWSHPAVQISPKIISEPPTKNKTVPSNPGTTHPNNTSRPSDSESDAITAIPAKYVMFVCIVMTVVLMWGVI